MSVGVLWHQVRAAEVAEVCSAFEADHVIATMTFLRWRTTRRTRRTESLHVLQRCFLLFVEFALSSRVAATCLAMPAPLTDRTERIATVLAYAETVRDRYIIWSFLPRLAGRQLHHLVLDNIVEKIVGFWIVLGSCCTLAPLTWTVDSILISL